MEQWPAYLKDNGTLENDQHESRKKRIVPVLVQAPQSNAEYLKDKERCHRMLSEQFGELWYRNVTFVLPVRGVQGFKRRSGGRGRWMGDNPSSGLE